ncbi:MAG: S4 domain-containing protein YaaA [Erysipelotrichaceae bacterium]|nr:S4 domain-containing protein YaaA [Erysipelotrichaceae bacterium]
MENIEISSEYIELGQFLKVVDLVSSGGEAKSFLRENEVIINEEADDRRGRKLYKGDIVEVLGKKYRIC